MDLASMMGGGGGLGGTGIEAKSSAATSFGDVNYASRGAGTPSWLLPVVIIGAGLLLAVLVFRK